MGSYSRTAVENGREAAGQEGRKGADIAKTTKQSQPVLSLQQNFRFLRFIFALSGNTALGHHRPWMADTLRHARQSRPIGRNRYGWRKKVESVETVCSLTRSRMAMRNVYVPGLGSVNFKSKIVGRTRGG